MEMSKILAKVSAYFRSRTQVGVDKAGNQYFIRPEKVDGVSEFFYLNFPYILCSTWEIYILFFFLRWTYQFYII